MAINFLDFQVVEFDDQVNLIDKGYQGDNSFCQLVALNDLTKFQISSTPEAPNTLERVLFGPGWTSISGQSTYNGGIGVLESNPCMVDTVLYRVVFNVEGILQGSLTVGNNNDNLSVIADGSYTLYIEGDSTGLLTFTPDSDLNVDVVVSGFECREMPDNYKAAIYDTSNVFQSEITDIDYTRNYSTFTVDWGASGLSVGKYKFGIFDGNTQLIENGSFDSTQGWVLDLDTSDTLDIISGFLRWISDGSSHSTATYPNVLESGKQYRVRIYIEQANTTTDIVIKLGTTSGATINTFGGTFEQTITSNGTDLVIDFTETAGLDTTVRIEAISITEVVDIEMETPGNFSNEFCYSDCEADTHILSWCNLSDANGLGYGDTGFVNVLRTEGKLKAPRGAGQEYNRYDLSGGRTRVLYHKEREAFDFYTGLLPQRLLRALMYARGADYFGIENEGFKFEEGDFEPNWQENNDYLSYVIIEVHRAQQALPKIRCVSGSDPDCSFPPSYWVWADGESKLLLAGEDGAYLLGDQF